VRWIAFCLFAFVSLVLDVSAGNILVLADVRPSFVAVLAVFIALFAPRLSALWACWILGLLVDLNTWMMHGPDRAGPLLGAYALGFAFGAILLLQLRPMLFRRRALTLAVMTFLFVAAAGLIVVAIYAAHGWYPREELHWAQLGTGRELLRRLGIAAYSALLALLLARALVWSLPLWAFRAPSQRAAARR